MSGETALRPHHGLCLGFFEGRGYSGEFSRNMSSVLTSLTPDSPIRLAEGHDVLCARCPERTTPCRRAAVYDRRVLSLCGLRAGQLLSWEQFRQAIQSQILSPGRLASVCGDCRWAEICLKKAPSR